MNLSDAQYAELAELHRVSTDPELFEKVLIALYAGDRNIAATNPNLTLLKDDDAVRWSIARALSFIRVLREERHKAHE